MDVVANDYAAAFPWAEAGRRALPLLGGKVATFAMTLACFIIVAKHLGPERFGLYSLAYGLPWLLLPGVDFGFSTVIAREIAAGDSTAWALTGIKLAASSLPIAVLALLGGGWLLGVRGQAAWLLLVSAIQLGTFVLRPAEAVLIANRATHTVAVCSVAANAVSLAGLLFATAKNFPDAFILLVHAGYIVVYYGLIGLMVWPKLTSQGQPAPNRLWKEAWPFGVGSAAASVTDRVGVVVSVALLGPAAGGFYSAAYRLYEVGVAAAGTVATVIRPVLAEVSHSPEILAGRAEALLRGSTAVSGAVALAVVGGAPLLVRGLFGPAYREASVVLLALAPALANILPGNVLADMCVAARQGKRFLVAAGSAGVISAGGSLILGQLVGPAGPALALGAAGTFAMGWILSGVHDRLGSPSVLIYGEFLAVWWALFVLLIAANAALSAYVSMVGGVAAGLAFSGLVLTRRTP